MTEKWRQKQPEARHGRRDRRRGWELAEDDHTDFNGLKGFRTETPSFQGSRRVESQRPQSLRDETRHVPADYVDPNAPKKSEGRTGYLYGNGSGYRDPRTYTFVGRMEAVHLDQSEQQTQSSFPGSALRRQLGR